MALRRQTEAEKGEGLWETVEEKQQNLSGGPMYGWPLQKCLLSRESPSSPLPLTLSIFQPDSSYGLCPS